MSRVYLFPDTNLFIQCKPLKELDWSLWTSFDEVCLLVSRPIQKEIDKHKGSGSSRLSKRARTTSSLFRDILKSENKYIEVRSKNPTVRIYLRTELKRDESLSDQLSYDEPDDQLVGITALFAKTYPDAAVLTHDTGPMATADMVGVKFIEIPDSWLLPLETNDSEKRINALQAELTRIKKAEPEIAVRFDGVEDSSTFEETILFYTALDDQQVVTLVDRIKRYCTQETHFGPRKPEERHNLASKLYGEKEIFTPASDEEITLYINKHYPKWLRVCKEFLSNLHERLNADTSPPETTVWLSNIGSRPADNTLVTLSALSNFQIQPPLYVDEEEPKTQPELSLPLPPSAPQGRWSVHRSSSFDMLYNPAVCASQFSALHHDRLSRLATPYIPPKRDPNAFYYQKRPELPVDSYSLICQQWRHQDDEVAFDLTLHAELKPQTISGAIEVKVQAANMSDTVIKHQQVRIIVQSESIFKKAEELVESLINKANPIRLGEGNHP